MTLPLALAFAGFTLALLPVQVPAPSTKQPAEPLRQEPAHLPADSPFASDKAELVGDGYAFTEGPAWVAGSTDAEGRAASGFFVFCDMRGSRVYRYDNGAEKPVVLREPSGRAVGSTADASGTVFNVETETRSITAWSIDSQGTPTAPRTVTEKISENGEPLGGMNDIALARDGTLYVTHGTWFLPRGTKSPFTGVLRVAKDGTTSKAADGLDAPNGVALSPDGRTLYVTEYSAARIQAFEVHADGTLGERRLIANLMEMAAARGIKARGGADGLRCDMHGNIYSTGPGGIWVLSPEGQFLGHLAQPATNIAFGGVDGKTLLITCGSTVMRIGTKTAGAGW
ncbi:MAG: SMP-30/gluconolactonase/LRE family protein [Phycisphaerae bacterium]|nr:SMP-30/gluconolactonase/LRE family protein [Phycisphaerae bacterium]